MKAQNGAEIASGWNHEKSLFGLSSIELDREECIN